MIRLLIAAALWTMAGTASGASEPARIDWADLIDATAQTYDDPYSDLDYDQIDDLRTIAVSRDRLAGGELTEDARAKIEERLDAALGRLADAGIDADWLISQRWVVAERRKGAATAGNADLDGRVVSLAGYAIPVPSDPDGTAIAYLVPERGMCSHTPPPNPNQMIRVRLTDDWVPSYMHEPVFVTGRLTLSPTVHEVPLVDGRVAMRAAFELTARAVEPLAGAEKPAQGNSTQAWADGIAERLREAGQLVDTPLEPSE